jgi:hypothetical protein
VDPQFLSEEGTNHDKRISTCSATFDGEVNLAMLQQWLKHLTQMKGADLFRYKGLLAVKGMREKFVFQGVHMLFTLATVDEQFWAPTETRTCSFQFIGRDLDKAALLGGFEQCKVTEELVLRFKPGDMVEARTRNGWQLGKILRLWDAGNAYRIELCDGRKTNVWGPVDKDEFVRLPVDAVYVPPRPPRYINGPRSKSKSEPTPAVEPQN